ncbi:Acyl-coenzyme A:6-aminopenicillanic acid acyl-transferase [Enhygromyxa salina]|uniref:Acyl-coenzyme A:6-aminopenicillanic acid acyl-transferase n=1 Tax=Enhygromyxa salina TaxID=215803 RepID=A0A2S9Y2Q5_9BACT|nr:carcinine hydrolase/isopenicillin-N N-acyltransferase family protein [Enhygromyxa salina]PRP99366.1 Acyl-coenzyme A:6-aminopenicillanic acid acyl-transferase [Enhygromyxa salina]
MAELDLSVIGALIDGRAAALARAGVGLDALRPHVERLCAEAPVEAGELLALAQRCGRPLHELLVLDGGLAELLGGVGFERSLGLYVDGPNGAVLAGAWALPASEAEQVELREVPVDDEGTRHAWVFGLPGSLGLAGISPSGHAVVANLLRPNEAGPGIPGSALLRQLLGASDLDQARASIEATPLADGRNWMLADGRSFFGYEQLGAERILTRVGPKTGHVHANHCFDPSLRQREARPRSAPSFRRLELASTLYVMRRPDTAASVLEFLTEVEEAAFADPAARAHTQLAIELETGRALWRRRAGDPIEHER